VVVGTLMGVVVLLMHLLQCSRQRCHRKGWLLHIVVYAAWYTVWCTMRRYPMGHSVCQ
jgi:hypothetical protein